MTYHQDNGNGNEEMDMENLGLPDISDVDERCRHRTRANLLLFILVVFVALSVFMGYRCACRG